MFYSILDISCTKIVFYYLRKKVHLDKKLFPQRSGTMDFVFVKYMKEAWKVYTDDLEDFSCDIKPYCYLKKYVLGKMP